MTIQLSTTLRNAMMDQYDATIGTTAVLRIHSGAQPVDCTVAHVPGTLLDTITLPNPWMQAASSGSVLKTGTWAGGGASGAGTAGHYRLWNPALTVCHEQGSVTITGGGGDLTLDNNVIASSQIVTVTSWTRTQGGA